MKGIIETLGTGQCVFLGEAAGLNTTIGTGTNNTLLGFRSGLGITSNSGNTSVGSSSLDLGVFNEGNTSVGYQALFSHSNFNSSAAGYLAGTRMNLNSSNSIAFGSETFGSNPQVSTCIAFGYITFAKINANINCGGFGAEANTSGGVQTPTP